MASIRAESGALDPEKTQVSKHIQVSWYPASLWVWCGYWEQRKQQKPSVHTGAKTIPRERPGCWRHLSISVSAWLQLARGLPRKGCGWEPAAAARTIWAASEPFLLGSVGL